MNTASQRWEVALSETRWAILALLFAFGSNLAVGWCFLTVVLGSDAFAM